MTSSIAWKLEGACTSADPALFYSEEAERHDEESRTLRVRTAKEYCDRCPVSGNCLDSALENDEQGIWGGTTYKERKRIKRSGTRVFCPRCRVRALLLTDTGQACAYCGLSWLR